MKSTERTETVKKLNKSLNSHDLLSISEYPLAKIPPEVTYTYDMIGALLGVSGESVRKRYNERTIQPIYNESSITILKEGGRFNHDFLMECVLIRQHCHPDRLVLNKKGVILRHPPEPGQIIGNPVIEPNPEKLTKKAYIKMRWEEKPELRPMIAENSVEVITGELVEAPKAITTKYNVETLSNLDLAGDNIEDLAESSKEFLDWIDAIAKEDAGAAVARYAYTFSSNTAEGIKQFRDQTKKAFGGNT
ncbi:MAG: hypothetical protein F6K63_29800 [Moorea sp. SIO1G6]|uniref:hypothetical protein n=1 Tax=Moorena sp. SIO1G6 TaxID=2607840 RepID=UPI0013BF2B24|nr:hypothetical protein [Moorena sp. SIO1G6]NET68364.1 hypothetical protein [Moorena sp. SIO1G6]